MTIPRHRFRTTPFLRLNTLWLEAGRLCWQKGSRVRHIPFADIRSLRLQSRLHEGHLLHLCEIRTNSDKHTLYNVERARVLSRQQDDIENSAASFAELVPALATWVQDANPDVQFLQGISHKAMLASQMMMAVASLVIVVGLGLMLWHRELAIAPVLMIGAVIAFLPMLYAEIRLGKAIALSRDEFVAAVCLE